MAGVLAIVLTAAAAWLLYQSLRALALSRARARFAREHGCKPPPSYPHKIPFLGLDYTLETKRAWDASRCVEKMEHDYVKFGRTFRLVQFGTEMLATIQPENLKAIFLNESETWGVEARRKVAMEPFLGKTFVSNDGEFRKHSRALTRPPMSKSEVGNLSVIEFHWQRLLAKLPTDGSTVDMKPLFDMMTQDFASDYLFGETIGSLAPERTKESEEMEKNIAYCMKAMNTRLMMADLCKILPIDKQYLKATAAVRKFVDEQVEKALHRKQDPLRKANTRKRIFIEDILDETSDKELIRNTSVVMFAASNDTTSYTLGNALFFLSRNPQALAKLKEEVSALGPKAPDASTIAKMPYLRAVILETLRVRHAVLLTLRVAMKDTILPVGGGTDGKSPVFVKKGTVVFMNFGAHGRDKSNWGPDAEEFRPERQLDRELEPWLQLPFGAGTRVCPGQTFAITNIKYVLVRLLQNFKDIESRDDRPWTEKIQFGVANKNGTHVGLIPA